MKALSLLAFVLFIMPAFAENPAPPAGKAGPLFGEIKAKRLSNIDKRISALNELKSCISSAAEHAAMKTCDAKHRQQMDSLKEDNQGFKQHLNQERQEMRAKKAGAKTPPPAAGTGH